jgi:hemoglobin-like flavoprotein
LGDLFTIVRRYRRLLLYRETHALKPVGVPKSEEDRMNTELVAKSWDSLGDRKRAVMESFYDRFFERFPQYRQFFPESMDQQMDKMVRTIAMAARLSDDQSTVELHMIHVGERHKPYHLGKVDLMNFKAMFIENMGVHCQDLWNESYAKAWDEVFVEVIVPLMMQGLGDKG